MFFVRDNAITPGEQENTACAITVAVDVLPRVKTAMRVAAGAIAKKYLGGKSSASNRGCLTQMGDIPLETKTGVRLSLIRSCPDADKLLIARTKPMRALKKRATPSARK